MRLQFEGQRWRIRVDEGELQRLLAGAPVALRSDAAGCFSVSAAVRLTPDTAAHLDGDASCWTLALPEAAVRELAGRLPCREGVQFKLSASTPEKLLEVLFDVDVRDSARRITSNKRSRS